MTRRATSSARRGFLSGAVLALALLCAGCKSSQPNRPTSLWSNRSSGKKHDKNVIDPTKIETRDDIFQIIQYWSQMPWLQASDRVVGFKVTVYFVSGSTDKGAFVPGDIFVWLYELTPTPDGRRERKLVHMWEFDESEAVGFRVTKRAAGGYYYGFPLTWPPELSLEGKLVEIQFGYERADKRLILSEPREFKVPVPVGFEPPAQPPEQ